jgi:hypothetical protein
MFSRMMGEVAIGYCAHGDQHPKLNPDNKAVVRKWARDDQIIVIADD